MDKGKAEKIFIDVDRDSTYIKIKVNDEALFYCDARQRLPRYDWNAEDKVMVRIENISRLTFYITNVTSFYARKSAAGTLELLFDESFGQTGTYHAFHIDPDYVEFGYEFNIVGSAQ